MNQGRYPNIRSQLSCMLKKHWGRLMGVAQTEITDMDDLLTDNLHERLALSKQEADRQLHEFMIRNRHWSDLSQH